MGINNFSAWIKKYSENCCYDVPLENFRGKRVAIDMNNLIYMMISVAIKDILRAINLAEGPPDLTEIERRAIDRILARLEVFMECGITPVCVFDGPSIPLKHHAHEKRDKNRKRVQEKLAEAERRLYSTDPMFRTSGLMDEYAKYYKQDPQVRQEFVFQIKDILRSSGFPVLEAETFDLKTNDAEAICASLCIEGNDYCFAAHTTDSDFHTYGGNLAILDIEKKYKIIDGVHTQVCIARIRSLMTIMGNAQLTFDAFQDLCIMLGTDFNPNIPNVGPVRVTKLIRDHGTVPEISRQMDTSVLKYPEVKSIFMSPICRIEIVSPDFNREIFRNHGRDTFDLHGLADHATIIGNLLKSFEFGLILNVVSSAPKDPVTGEEGVLVF